MMEKPRNLKKNSAITLIALIITIIVMLILVVVSIQIALNTGLFDSAGKATKDWKTAQDKEQELASGTVNIGGVWYDSIDDYLNKTPSENIKIKLSMVHNAQEVTADATKVSEIKEGVPIPKGYYYVGGTKDTGVVISDEQTDKDLGLDAELQGNQFVWVPVLQNQKLKIEIKSREPITAIKVEDALYNEITKDKDGNAILASGTSYVVEVEPTINGLYTVTVTAGGETVEQTLRLSGLYAQDFWNDYMHTDDEGLHDIDWAKEYVDSNRSTYAESVNKYGGFYIARYEAGSEVVEAGNQETLPQAYSKKNMYPYSYVDQGEAITLSQAIDQGSTSVTSDLINAAGWDRTSNWLIETNRVSKMDMVYDSKSWGNYDNSTFSFTGKYNYSEWTETMTPMSKPAVDGNPGGNYLLGTGVTEYTNKNNIYDLAGNCWEWTLEMASSSYAVIRSDERDWGDPYGNNGTYRPAATRTNVRTSENWHDGSFRPVLYINL